MSTIFPPAAWQFARARWVDYTVALHDKETLARLCNEAGQDVFLRVSVMILEAAQGMDIVRYSGAIILGYLAGSFPTGYVAARLYKGIDPREHGSGRTGGTNILRSAGRGAALLTVIGDVLKGAVAVMLARALVGTDVAIVMAGLAAVIGHNHSIFLGFRGGAGSMTNAGVVLATVPYVVPFMAAAAIIGALLSRIASVASIAAAATMVVVLLASFCLRYTSIAYVIYGLLACALIVYELRPNIHRLRSGTERRVEHY